MKALMRTGIATLATSVGAGLVVVGVSAANADGDDQTYAKREDSAQEWIVVADDDDDGDDDNRLRDGTNTNTKTGISRGTRHSRESSGRSGDRTRSRGTAVSLDRDKSWGDKSHDFTRDGKGGVKRDLKPNLTNDRSRNDTRPRR